MYEIKRGLILDFGDIPKAEKQILDITKSLKKGEKMNVYSRKGNKIEIVVVKPQH